MVARLGTTDLDQRIPGRLPVSCLVHAGFGAPSPSPFQVQGYEISCGTWTARVPAVQRYAKFAPSTVTSTFTTRPLPLQAKPRIS